MVFKVETPPAFARRGLFLSHWVFHSLPANKMKMHVENGLPAVCTGIVDDAESARIDALALSQYPRDTENVAD
jgi:hypothetical protein